MISIDTNLLLYAQNKECPQHKAARAFLDDLRPQTGVAICELVLVEFYLLLRNPAVSQKPLSSRRAVRVCQTYRTNSKWERIEHAPVMSAVWEAAMRPGFARRRIIDLRLALTLQHFGVTEFATANVKDFQDFGFDRVWNPLEE